MPGPPFELNHVAREGRHRLELAGELDLVGAPALEATVSELTAAGAREIVLDLRRVRFIDSTGLRALLTSAEACDGRCRFALIQGSRPIQRLFEMTGLIDRLPFTEPEG